MLQMHKRMIAVLAACVTLIPMSLPAMANVASNPALGRDVCATLTSKHGIVFKRSFRDWNREQWGEPQPAQVSDELREGMQIGTGNESWAEVTWPNVKTRAWSNTVFAVAPNKRLVYLTGGEMLFRLDKNRKDKEDYFIWTKVLQARIRGTTVLVQAKGPVTRFTVLEGVVEIKNRLDNSRATLKPGAVYEIKGYNVSNRAPLPSLPNAEKLQGAAADGDAEAQQALPQLRKLDGSINDIAYDSENFLPLFQDKFATTNLYASNSEALLNHPLITAGGTIDSLPLIQAQQKELPGYSKILPLKMADNSKLKKIISCSVLPVAVPSKSDYYVGQSVGHEIKLPSTALGDLPPKGVVLNPSSKLTWKYPQVPTSALAPRPALPPIPGLMLPVPEETTPAKVFDDAPASLPQVRYGGSSEVGQPSLHRPGLNEQAGSNMTTINAVSNLQADRFGSSAVQGFTQLSSAAAADSVDAGHASPLFNASLPQTAVAGQMLNASGSEAQSVSNSLNSP